MSLFQVTKKQVIENYELRTMTGDIVSFTPSYSQLLPDPFSDLNVTVNVLATGGNGTPDNPNPINGYTEANITRCGVNLFNGEIRNGYYNSSTGAFASNGNMIANVTPIKVIPNSTIYISSGTYNIGITEYDANMSFIRQSAGKKNETLTLSATTAYINFSNTWNAGSTYNNDISINYPSTDTTYHAYNGQTYTIAFGQTVYGGVLDVTRGKLTVTHGGTDLSTLNWTASTYGYRTADLASIVKAPATDNIKVDIISEEYNPVARNNIGSQGDNNIAISTSGNILVSSNSTPTGFTVYELATPFDIDLTPEVISAVVGTNNVFADCWEMTVTCLI